MVQEHNYPEDAREEEEQINSRRFNTLVDEELRIGIVFGSGSRGAKEEEETEIVGSSVEGNE